MKLDNWKTWGKNTMNHPYDLRAFIERRRAGTRRITIRKVVLPRAPRFPTALVRIVCVQKLRQTL